MRHSGEFSPPFSNGTVVPATLPVENRGSREIQSRFVTTLPSRRDLCGESDTRKRGGKGCPDPCPPLPSPVPHQRPKGAGRSHHQHPSRAARHRTGREGDTRGAASLRLFTADARNPCRPTSDGAFRGSPQPQRRGLRPLRERPCGCQNHVHL